MKRHVVAFTGISGVGKSTFLRNLKTLLQFQHLQASELIASERQTFSLDELRNFDLNQNQSLLINGFRKAVDPVAKVVVLDCHTVIEVGDGVVRINPDVFKEVGINSMLFLADQPTAIASRRLTDSTRKRPVKNEEELATVQTAALAYAKEICGVLEISMTVVNSAQHQLVANLLSR
jgi:adenylate kinase